MNCDCESCFYCDSPLARRHEHDHFPVPKHAGGRATVPACMNCHELKDRTPLSSWDVTVVGRALLELLDGRWATSPPGRQMNPVELVEVIGEVEDRWVNLGPTARIVYAKLRYVIESERALLNTPDTKKRP